MNSRRALAVSLGFVALLYAFAVHYKTARIFRNPTWDAHDDTGQFWSEFAFQYRFAEYFARHPIGDWHELADDQGVQYPDRVDDWAEFTVAMEVPVGALYRWLDGRVALPPFHVWVVWYDCLVSSLALFAVFLLARALWQSNLAGVAAAVFDATLYPSYGRTIRHLFLREDFALPLILLALLFTVRALQGRSACPAGSGEGGGWQDAGERGERDRQDACPPCQILAGLFWLAALASWHLTQFVLAVLVGALVLVWLTRRELPRLPWLVLVLAVGGLTIPVLRAKQFYLSPVMDALYALALVAWMNGGRRKQLGTFFGASALLLAAGLLAQKSYGEYAHVYQLFFDKLRFLGQKPADPAALPWEARLLWEGAFNTATAGEFWHSLRWCLPLAVIAVASRRFWARAARGGDAAPPEAVRVFAVFGLLLVLLAWMVVRYFTFLGVATAVLAAGLMTRRFGWKLAVVAAALWQLVMLDWQPLVRIQPAPAEYRPVVQWLEKFTPTNAVVLASISESPVFWAHTGRPMILHSKFENREIRNRYHEFLEAIYANEDQFQAFCRRYGADYFVNDTGYLLRATDSRRYKADKMGALPADCAARLLAEHPERLRHFRLELPATDESRFAVFRVLP